MILNCACGNFSASACYDFFGGAGGSGHAQRFRAAAGHVLLILDLRILFAGGGQRGADLFHVQLLREAERGAVAAREIHAEQFRAAIKNPVTHADENDRPGQNERRLGQLHEVELGGADEVEHPAAI